MSPTHAFSHLVICFWIGALVLATSSAVAQDAEPDPGFQMFNAVWIKEDGGAAKYAQYLRLAQPFVEKYGGKRGPTFVPEEQLIGKFDADLVFMVEWPDAKSFAAMIQDPGYKSISHLREDAIESSVLIRMRELGARARQD
jgi:uncharacterized protein (DUF1330 family)